jgi:hypothetical protein
VSLCDQESVGIRGNLLQHSVVSPYIGYPSYTVSTYDLLAFDFGLIQFVFESTRCVKVGPLRRASLIFPCILALALTSNAFHWPVAFCIVTLSTSSNVSSTTMAGPSR